MTDQELICLPAHRAHRSSSVTANFLRLTTIIATQRGLPELKLSTCLTSEILRSCSLLGNCATAVTHHPPVAHAGNQTDDAVTVPQLFKTELALTLGQSATGSLASPTSLEVGRLVSRFSGSEKADTN
jgi:hypothetical protein